MTAMLITLGVVALLALLYSFQKRLLESQEAIAEHEEQLEAFVEALHMHENLIVSLVHSQNHHKLGHAGPVEKLVA